MTERKIEIARELLDDEQLLVILLAEERRPPAGTAATASSPRWRRRRKNAAASRLQAASRCHATVTSVAKPSGYITARSGRVEQVAARAREQRGIAGFVARVAFEVLVRRELARIDEQAGDDETAALLRRADQREVPLVQRAHGRNQADA